MSISVPPLLTLIGERLVMFISFYSCVLLSFIFLIKYFRRPTTRTFLPPPLRLIASLIRALYRTRIKPPQPLPRSLRLRNPHPIIGSLLLQNAQQRGVSPALVLGRPPPHLRL